MNKIDRTPAPEWLGEKYEEWGNIWNLEFKPTCKPSQKRPLYNQLLKYWCPLSPFNRWAHSIKIGKFSCANVCVSFSGHG
ncbi:MAG: hypothetical protein GY749_29690 [Desulfobacteraceae bacterium]|nr:hypothetical protein [Desulfobacteraceae bacterium]